MGLPVIAAGQGNAPTQSVESTGGTPSLMASNHLKNRQRNGTAPSRTNGKGEPAAQLDPERPCLTQREARRAGMVLFSVKRKWKRNKWMLAINRVFHELKVNCRDDDFLMLVISAIHQESGGREDPPLENTNLEQLLEFKLERLGDKNPLARHALGASGIEDALAQKLRRDNKKKLVKTEADLVRYIEKKLRPWFGKHLEKEFSIPRPIAELGAEIGIPNPVTTLGPMQVNIFKAYRNAVERGEKLDSPREMQAQLLDQKTALYRGLKEGIYLLWQSYRFYRRNLNAEKGVFFAGVDYNAGEFSSRNAAFQERLVSLAREDMALDGDLLLYRSGVPLTLLSKTERALQRVLPKSDPKRLRNDLLLEKTPEFSKSKTARQICRRYRIRTKKTCILARIPEGAGNSTGKLKTGRAFTPATYGKQFLKRFHENRKKFQAL